MSYAKQDTAPPTTRYAKSTTAVVVGWLAASAAYRLAPTWSRLDIDDLVPALLTFGLVIGFGFALGVYGLFRGIETAVAAGCARTADDVD